MGGGGLEGPHHNFFVIAPMIIKFGTVINLGVFYRMVTRKFVTSLLLRNYDVITCILLVGLNFRCSQLPSPFTDLTEIGYLEVFWGACFKYQVRFYF